MSRVAVGADRRCLLPWVTSVGARGGEMWEQQGRPAPNSPVPLWAASQSGLVTRAQALDAGLSRDASATRGGRRPPRPTRRSPGGLPPPPGLPRRTRPARPGGPGTTGDAGGPRRGAPVRAGRRARARSPDGRTTAPGVYDDFATVVEVDGRLGHERWSDRVRDGRRDRSAGREGSVTTRVFWPDVAVSPCDTAADIGAVLRVRGWSGRPRPCRRRDCAVRPSGIPSLGGSAGL